MTQESIVRTRLALWYRACEFWHFLITPPLTRELLAAQLRGSVGFSASRTVRMSGSSRAATLTVVEIWLPGADPLDDRRLEREGCHVAGLSWHLQVDAQSGPSGADRLDVVRDPAISHPRIHHHPYGLPNHVRRPAELPPPQAWLHDVNRRLAGALAEAGEQQTIEPS